MIDIRRVFKAYGRRTALADVSLQILPGEVTLLLGANGAGKSTLLRCLLGITEFEGTIQVAGINPLVDGCSVRALVGYMPQSGGLHQELTVEETFHLYADIRQAPRDRCKALLQEAGLADHKAARVGDLSGGLRQRLGFTLALLSDPRILVLDEPTASLDAASREWLAGRLQAVAAEGRTVLVSTHAGQELLAVGDHRIVLEGGRVLSDTRTSPSPPACTAAAGTPGTVGGSVRPLVAKEVRDAVSNRWLLTYTIVLGVLGLAAAQTGLESSSGLALQAFGRTTATLMNLCLLLAPLVAVLMGGSSIAGERERGTLENLLAQPLSRTGLLLAKHAGLLLSLTAATCIGFVPAGALVAWHTGLGMLGQYLLFPLIAVLAGAAMVAIGMLVSVSSRTAVQSQGAAVFIWFAFVLLYDLVLMGSLAVSGMPVGVISFTLIANPVDAARVLGVLSLEPDLYLLGPAGAYLTARFSRGGAAAVLCVSLFLWATVPLLVATLKFRLRGSQRTRLAQRRSMASPDEVNGFMSTKTSALLVAMAALGLTVACSSQAKDTTPVANEASKAAPAVSAATLEQGRALYKANCVACHGETGKGDGPGAGVLKPPPRDHTDRAYMGALTDKQIADIIKMGGAMKGKPLMPSHPQFKDPQLAALVAYVRSLSEPPK